MNTIHMSTLHSDCYTYNPQDLIESRSETESNINYAGKVYKQLDCNI